MIVLKQKVDLQPETRLYTTDKVIKIIILIFLIPLPPNVFIKKSREGKKRFDSLIFD